MVDFRSVVPNLSTKINCNADAKITYWVKKNKNKP